MEKLSVVSKKKLIFLLVAFEVFLGLLLVRVFYIQTFKGEELKTMAYEQQTRDRLITPDRGSILDRNMVGIAETETVASVSVIPSQIKDKEKVVQELSARLDIEYDVVLKKTEKKVALERIKSKVDKEIADEIRELKLDGIAIDEDIKRIYPYNSLASQVVGFVGKDNQGIIGLEAKYDSYLQGKTGKILTETDVKGRRMKGGNEYRIAPESGNNLVISIDVILQQYAEQVLDKAMEAKQAKKGIIILMNPKNGEIYAMANKPNFDLNEPFTINKPELEEVWEELSSEERNNELNQMWRNSSINDTYEPGSTFKIITSVAGLEEKVVAKDSPFVCNGFHVVGGRDIKCWRYPNKHGLETFVQGVYNSCNPVFMIIAERLGAEVFYKYLDIFAFDEKTGIDLPGEAVGIMHKLEKVGPVELATMSFGQSFQITPMQLLRSASAVINGGDLITPHFAVKTVDSDGNIVEVFDYPKEEGIVSKESSEIMKEILEGVVYIGTGNKTYIPGYRVGGKTATSEKLPRRSGKYIASFLSFAPAEDPEVIALVLIDEPQGVYYGGTVAGPIMKELLENTLPYLNIEPIYTYDEEKLPEAQKVIVPDFTELGLKEAKKIIEELGLVLQIEGEGDVVENQFPMPNAEVNAGTKLILYVTNSEDGE